MIPNTPFFWKRISTATTTEGDSLRVVVFASADYLFALPVGAVLKVIACPLIRTPVENGIGTVDLGTQTITIVDLRQKLNPQAQLAPAYASSPGHEKQFLLLTQTRTGEICGICADKPPFLLDIPPETVRPLPWSYRQAMKLNFVSHMAVVPAVPTEEPLKLLLLGINQILAEKQKTAEQQLHPQRQQFLRIFLGNEMSGLLPSNLVVEIISVASQEISPTLALPRWMVGLCNWQEGQMLRLIDLQALVCSSPLSPRDQLTVVVFELENQIVGFVVPEVGDIEWHALEQVQSPGNAPLRFVVGALPGKRWILDTKAIATEIAMVNPLI